MSEELKPVEAVRFEIVFWEQMSEWVLLQHDPLVPYDLRFKDPEPGKGGAIGYARFIGRKTGGLIRVKGPGRCVETIFFPIERLE